jgi:outer membrane protein
MNMNLQKSLRASALALALFLTAASTQAQMKLATVDMKKVFDSFYKTKQAEQQIKDRGADSEKVYKGMVEDYQKANDEYRKLVEGSNDQAVSAEERDKRKKSAEAKLSEIQDIEKQVKQFQVQARTTLGELEKRMREGIVKDIRDAVNTRAKSGNYNMVFDTSAQTVYQTPYLLYTSGQPDLTDDVIKELNASAPPGFSPDAEPKTQDILKDLSKPSGSTKK